MFWDHAEGAEIHSGISLFEQAQVTASKTCLPWQTHHLAKGMELGRETDEDIY